MKNLGEIINLAYEITMQNDKFILKVKRTEVEIESLNLNSNIDEKEMKCKGRWLKFLDASDISNGFVIFILTS